MSQQQLEQFASTTAYLKNFELSQRGAALGRQCLGIGRVVDLEGVPTGVYGRFGHTLDLRFVQRDNVAALVRYRDQDGTVVKSDTENLEQGLSVPYLAKSMGVTLLEHGAFNAVDLSVSDEEMQFLAEFVGDPENRLAVYELAVGVGGVATHLEISDIR